jgi:predicted transcriptional regulator
MTQQAHTVITGWKIRDRYALMADMLQAMPQPRDELQRLTGTCKDTSNRILRQLMDYGLVDASSSRLGYYVATEKGLRFLVAYRELLLNLERDIGCTS